MLYLESFVGGRTILCHDAARLLANSTRYGLTPERGNREDFREAILLMARPIETIFAPELSAGIEKGSQSHCWVKSENEKKKEPLVCLS